jgi:hypothetical protein
VKTLDSLVEKALSRRTFLASAGAVAATAAVSGCSSSGTTTPVTTSPITTTPVTTMPTGAAYTDADLLNYALNLEYLEAQFYLYAATGAGLSGVDTVAPSGYTGSFSEGTVTVGSAAAVPGLTSAQQEILNEIAFEEQTHVQFLRSALGSAALDPSLSQRVSLRPRPVLAPSIRFPVSITSLSVRSSSRMSASPPILERPL